ncbi:MAG TPA: hypothetical protein VN258_03055 [Mobilitalea sp.]|nr:hypothetical protein [Mobilitalea sp.]
MKKIIIFITILSLSILCIGCTKEDKTDWNPPIKGLVWGMSMDDVKEVLSGKESEISVIDGITYMKFKEKCKTVYGVELASTCIFEKDMKLYRFQGICDETEVPVIKNKLEESYGDYFSKTQPSNGTQWVSERVMDCKDYEEIMKRFYEKYGDLPDYDIMKIDFQHSSLVSFNLIESGNQIGTLIVNGGKQVLVDTLLSD